MRFPKFKHAVEAQMCDFAKERWGDVPISSKTITWEDGSYQIVVFHTIERVVGGEPLRVELMYDNKTGKTVERVAHLRVQETREEIYREEVEP